MRFICSVVIGLAAVAAAGPGCRRDSNEIPIGEFSSMTGGTATFGQSTHEGIMLAVDDVNAKGGVLGRKVRIILEDDQSRPEEASTAVLKLIHRDKVCAILGEVASTRSLAGAPHCQQNKIPMLTPSSTNPKVTQVGDYIFRACFIDPFQGSVMADFAFKRLGASRVAVLTDIKNDYSVGLTDFFKKRMAELGGQVVAEAAYSEGDTEFKAQLTTIRAAQPAAIYVPGYYTEVGLIARQARELGLTVPLLGGDGWDSEKTCEIGGSSVDGCYFTNHYSSEDPRPEVQSFVKSYKARYGKMPDALAVMGYDAAHIMLDAIRRAGSTEGPAIRDALAATRDFPGVSGKISMDAQRNAQKPIVVLKIERGEFKFVEGIEPHVGPSASGPATTTAR